MIFAAWIKLCLTRGTSSVLTQVILQSHFMPAHTTQYHFLMKMLTGPAGNRMIFGFQMTKITWIVLPATGKLNRYDIEF